MIAKLLASATLVIGLVESLLTLLTAFGVHITSDQHTAIEGVTGAVLALAGVYFHPDIPVGKTGA